MLIPFLTSEADAEAEECLNRLFSETVIPQIRRVLSSYLTLTSFEREELQSDSQARVLRRLRDLRNSHLFGDGSASPISDLPAYVSTVAFNARKDLIHARQPEWRRINYRILRLADEPDSGIRLMHFPDGTEIVALASHDGLRSREEVAVLVERVRARLANHLFLPVQTLVPAILESAKGGVARKDLVRAVVELTGAGDFAEIEMPEELNDIRTVSENDEMIAERQSAALRQIWEQVRVFPANQRKAMILSLRENRNTEAVSLLLRKRIATIREIAEALEVTAEEFAAIFERLPMSSSEIADFLGIEDGERSSKEQKVDNLRRVARDLLRRRLGIRK